MKKIFLTLAVCFATLSSFANNLNNSSRNFSTDKNISTDDIQVVLNVLIDGESKEFIFSSNSEDYSSKFDLYTKMINDKIVNSNIDDCTVSVKVRVGWGSNFVEVAVTRTVDCSQWIQELRKIKEEIQAELGM
ncbi:hypothetical protein ACOSP6_01785 [Tenacibaculum sp. MEBiC06402]|uniref:hypothetical protein n=1 Tax=unclassified Tenacibaculum TaxID=2635139 RepID=UPI003B9AED95